MNLSDLQIHPYRSNDQICHGWFDLFIELSSFISEDQHKQEEKKTITGTQILVALVCCVIDFGIAQLGLLNLI